MIEARIECLCTDFKVPDLGLQLVKGQVTWINAAKARGSADLLHAKQIKAVSVSWRERCAVARNKVPVWVGKSRVRELHQAARGGGVAKLPAVATAAPGPVEATPPAPSVKDVARELVVEMRHMVQDEVRAALAEQPRGGRQRPPDLDLNVSDEPDIEPDVDLNVPEVDGSDPVFIPKAAALDDASIAVTTQAASGEQVDAAASALKATKAKKQPQKKKE